MIWIWLKDKDARCAEFSTTFASSGGEAKLRIAAKDKYAVYINNQFVCNGRGIHNVPAHKCVAKFDVSEFLKEGDNILLVQSAYTHVEKESFPMPSAVAFVVVVDGKVIARSDAHTRAREPKKFFPGDMINDMLGYSLTHDFTAVEREWENCQVVETGCVEEKNASRTSLLLRLCLPQSSRKGFSPSVTGRRWRKKCSGHG